MMTKRILTAAVLAAGVLPSALAYAADPPNVDELQAQISALQRQVNQIQAQQAAAPQVQSTTNAVQQDANAQSSLLPTQALLAGYDNGFKLSSQDGRFVMKPGAYIQFRNITNYRNEDPSDLENGFEIRRFRMRLEGNAFSKDLRYFFQVDTNRNVGTISLLDAFVQYNFAGPWGVKLGQFRNSWVHEGDVSDTKQLAVERSLLDAVIGGTITDRTQAVALTYGGTGNNEDPFQGELAFTDGDNSKNTDFRDDDTVTAGRVNSDFGASARVSYKFFGAWADYADFSAKGDKQDLLVAGIGADFSENGDTNVTRGTADLQYENTYGLSAYGQIISDYTSGAGANNTDFGASGQIGYLINPAVEVFGRYSYLDYDAGFDGQDTFHELTVGANYFFGHDNDGSFGHAVKLTVDLDYLPNGSPGNLTVVDYLATTDSEFVLRAQFQLSL